MELYWLDLNEWTGSEIISEAMRRPNALNFNYCFICGTQSTDMLRWRVVAVGPLPHGDCFVVKTV